MPKLLAPNGDDGADGATGNRLVTNDCGTGVMLTVPSLSNGDGVVWPRNGSCDWKGFGVVEANPWLNGNEAVVNGDGVDDG